MLVFIALCLWSTYFTGSSQQVTQPTKLSEIDDAIANVNIIFGNDNGFMRRLAWVETGFGNKTTRGGVWNVHSEQFVETKRKTSKELLDNVTRYLAINWEDVSYNELSENISTVNPLLLSAFGARLYIASIGEPIPVNMSEQGEFWAEHFKTKFDNNKTAAIFVEKVQRLENQSNHTKVLIADNSHTTNSTIFSVTVGVVSMLLSALAIGGGVACWRIQKNNSGREASLEDLPRELQPIIDPRANSSTSCGVSEVACWRIRKNNSGRETLKQFYENQIIQTEGREGYLGKGGFGEVRKAQIIRTKQIVAIKTCNDFDMISREYECFKLLPGQHPNIVRCLGHLGDEKSGKNFKIVFELCEKGSLDKYLEGLQRQVPPMQAPLEQNMRDHFLKIAIGIAKGLRFLHESKFFHFDMAARNVLLTMDYIPKIGDFGMTRPDCSAIYDLNDSKRKTAWRWAAPQSFYENPTFVSKSDIWSYGVTLWEIFSLGQLPYEQEVATSSNRPLDWPQRLENRDNPLRLAQPLYATAEMYKVMTKCWNNKHTERPSAKDLIQDLSDVLENKVIPATVYEA